MSDKPPTKKTCATSLASTDCAPDALTHIEQGLGSRATRLAESKASAWIASVVPVIERRVLETAERGLFHCQLRFEDDVPMDPVNQKRIEKMLERQNLRALLSDHRIRRR